MEENVEEIDYYDKYIRILADMENFKRRKNDEINNAVFNAKKDIIINLLPIIDDIEKGVKYDQSLETLYNKLQGILGNIGIERFGTIGDKFDDNLHNAVFMFSTGDVPEGCISEIIKCGYKYNGEIIRYADVTVKYSGNQQ